MINDAFKLHLYLFMNKLFKINTVICILMHYFPKLFSKHSYFCGIVKYIHIMLKHNHQNNTYKNGKNYYKFNIKVIRKYTYCESSYG